MNRFVDHHRQSIAFDYACFDRLILNGIIQPLQTGGNVQRFFQGRHTPVTKKLLVGLSTQYHEWLAQQAATWGIDIVPVDNDNDTRREDLVQPYFQRPPGPHGLAVILRCREPERIAVCYPSRGNWVEVERRWISLYYFYLRDPQCGPLFLRVCPYFPFNLRVWLNGHDWLASRLAAEGIGFRKDDNAFLSCEDPQRLQQLSDAFAPATIHAALTALLPHLLPRLTQADWPASLQHRWFMSQIEYCHNLVFHQRAGLQRLFERLLDHNRALGHPDKVATIFRRRTFRPETTQSRVKVTMLGIPVINTGFNHTSVKQYLRPGGGPLRTEVTSCQLADLDLRKHLDHLPKVRDLFAATIERYHNAQQDILETYLDRGQLEQLRQATVTASGRRTPGMRLDDPRLLAVLHALTAFVHLLGKGCFRTKQLLADVRRSLDQPDYTLSQLRYDLAKLRGKGLLERVPGTQSYRLVEPGYRVAVLYLKLYHRLYAPLTAAILEPFPPDNEVSNARRLKLDRLYAAVDRTLTQLAKHVGIAQPA